METSLHHILEEKWMINFLKFLENYYQVSLRKILKELISFENKSIFDQSEPLQSAQLNPKNPGGESTQRSGDHLPLLNVASF